MATKPIGTLGTIDTLTIGGRVFTDLSTAIFLYGYVNGNNSTLRLSGGAAGYQVTAGKTLYLKAAYAQARVSGGAIELLYSDNDVAVSTATAFTNPVYFGRNAGLISEFLQAVVGQKTEIGVLDFAVPATKYVGITAAAALAVVSFIGFEV